MLQLADGEMLPDLRRGRFAIRASKLISMAGEKAARGKELFKKPDVLDNPLLLVENGFIADLKNGGRSIAPGYDKLDLGDAIILPPLVNAHCHLQLSWLEGQGLFGRGFSAWLGDMIPRLLSVLNGNSAWNWQKRQAKLEQVLKNIKNQGTYFIGDVGGSIAGELGRINALAKEEGIGLQNFCEHFGFDSIDDGQIWPPRCQSELADNARLSEKCSPCGHALYSTALDKLKTTKAWCLERAKVFSLHLAESLEEEQLLADGSGGLMDLYYGTVIPENWRPYGMRPYELAKKIGLVDRKTLFVHGVHLDAAEIHDLAQNGSAICLCPRSNANLNTGVAPVRKYMEEGARICLGTDGLCSNSDLNVLHEALYYREKEDLPFACLLRLCTVNGLDALGMGESCQLTRGARARIGIMDLSLLDEKFH